MGVLYGNFCDIPTHIGHKPIMHKTSLSISSDLGSGMHIDLTFQDTNEL